MKRFDDLSCCEKSECERMWVSVSKHKIILRCVCMKVTNTRRWQGLCQFFDSANSQNLCFLRAIIIGSVKMCTATSLCVEFSTITSIRFNDETDPHRVCSPVRFTFALGTHKVSDSVCKRAIIFILLCVFLQFFTTSRLFLLVKIISNILIHGVAEIEGKTAWTESSMNALKSTSLKVGHATCTSKIKWNSRETPSREKTEMSTKVNDTQIFRAYVYTCKLNT